MSFRLLIYERRHRVCKPHPFSVAVIFSLSFFSGKNFVIAVIALNTQTHTRAQDIDVNPTRWLNIDQVRRVTLSDWIDPMRSDLHKHRSFAVVGSASGHVLASPSHISWNIASYLTRPDCLYKHSKKKKTSAHYATGHFHFYYYYYTVFSSSPLCAGYWTSVDLSFPISFYNLF